MQFLAQTRTRSSNRVLLYTGLENAVLWFKRAFTLNPLRFTAWVQCCLCNKSWKVIYTYIEVQYSQIDCFTKQHFALGEKKSMQASLLWMWIKHIYQEFFMALCFQQISKNECSMHGAKFIPAMHSPLCIVPTTCGSKLKDLIGLCDERDSAH